MMKDIFTESIQVVNMMCDEAINASKEYKQASTDFYDVYNKLDKNNDTKTLQVRDRKLNLLREALSAVVAGDEDWLNRIDAELEVIERVEKSTDPHTHITTLLRNYDRVTQIFDDYRLKLTGSLESQRDWRMYDFIYRAQPNFQTEILCELYQQGVRDGLKIALS